MTKTKRNCELYQEDVNPSKCALCEHLRNTWIEEAEPPVAWTCSHSNKNFSERDMHPYVQSHQLGY